MINKKAHSYTSASDCCKENMWVLEYMLEITLTCDLHTHCTGTLGGNSYTECDQMFLFL